MPVDLSISKVPDDIVQRLHQRAMRHNRSLHSELMAIVEAAVREYGANGPAEILAEVRRLGLQTHSDAGSIVRADRDKGKNVQAI